MNLQRQLSSPAGTHHKPKKMGGRRWDKSSLISLLQR
jgi:hypothetical protein